MLIIDGKEYKINEAVAYIGKHICNNVKVLIWELGKLKRYNFLFFCLTVEQAFNYNDDGGYMDCKCLECDCNVIHDSVVKKTLKEMPKDVVITKIANFFKVIGDSTRAKILFALDTNEMCVCDIANVLNMTKSTISHQLSVLREERIVKCNRVGKEVYYSLDDEHVKDVYEVALSHVKEIINEKI